MLHLLMSIGLCSNPKPNNETKPVQQEATKQEPAKQALVSIGDRDPEQTIATYPENGLIKRKDIVKFLRDMGADDGIIKTVRPVEEINNMEMQIAAILAFNQYIVPLSIKEGVEKENAQMLDFIKKQFLFSKYLEKKGKELTKDEDVKQELERLKSELANEKFYTLSVIVLNTKKDADSIITQLKNKKTKFEDLVAKHSINEESKKQNGRLRPMSSKQLDAFFGKDAEILKQYKSNALVDKPIKLNNGYLVVQINNVERGDQKTFSDKAIADVMPYLTMKIQKDNQSKFIKTVTDDPAFKILDPNTNELKPFKDYPQIAMNLDKPIGGM